MAKSLILQVETLFTMIKRGVFILMFAVVVLTGTVVGQQQLFMVDIGGLPFGRAGVKYEHMILRRFSVGAFGDGHFMKYSGVSLSPFARFYAGEFTAPESFFVHMQLTAGTFSGPLYYRQYDPVGKDYFSFDKDESFTAVGYGIGIGRQWMLTYRTGLELSAGFQYMLRNTDREIEVEGGDHPGLYRLNGITQGEPVDNWFLSGAGGLVYLRVAIGLGWW
jgi:hypothetical protein